MTDRHVPPDKGGLDWRRLAADLNVSHGVAKALWQRAREAAPHDAVQAEHAFQDMLEEAAAANATHEPGRQTLVDTSAARDASSLGAGKWTRVLLEEKKPGLPKRGAEAARPSTAARSRAPGAKPSAEELHSLIAAATEASNHAAALLAASDPATIVEALRGLRGEGDGLVQKILNAAGGAIERILTATAAASAPAAEGAEPASTTAASTTAAAAASSDAAAGASPAAAAASPAAAAAAPAAAAASPAAAAASPVAASPAAASPADRARAASNATVARPGPATASRPAARAAEPVKPTVTSKPPSSKPSRS